MRPTPKSRCRPKSRHGWKRNWRKRGAETPNGPPPKSISRCRAPARLKQFERYLRQLQAYLAGDSVPFEEIDIPHDFAPSMSELHLHDAPPDSRIGWIAEGVKKGNAKVPVEVAASA